MEFLFPFGFLLVLVAIPLTLGVWAYDERTRAIARESTGFSARRVRATLVDIVLLCVAVAFLGAGAARPVKMGFENVGVRNDAAVVYAFDVSESQRARFPEGGENRLLRAQMLARDSSRYIGGVLSGVAAFTDSILPHLAATYSRSELEAAIRWSVAIDSVPTYLQRRGIVTTDFNTFASAQILFPQGSARKILVIFSDGEVRDLAAKDTVSPVLKTKGIYLVVVGIGSDDERLPALDRKGQETGDFDTHLPDFDGEFLRDFAHNAGGTYLYEPNPQVLSEVILEALGEGPTVGVAERRTAESLEWYMFFFAGLFAIPFMMRRLPFFRKTK